MKILRLRLTNLNSLRGSFEIDFTNPPLEGVGLFAITGATGAGKTTLLDAITLALYGRAARYGTQPSPDAVMSRHTGECSAEVEFSCASGTFRSVWQLHRARKKPGGDLQAPRQRVIELPSETVLCEKINQSQAKILELTGLDYDRFLRSVLLAQGEFAAFLKASAKERTELLQQVTGTGIYQEISRAAYRRWDSARVGLEQLISRNQALPLLEPEKRAEQQKQQKELEAQIAPLAQETQALAERLTAARRWIEWEAAMRELGRDQAALATEVTNAAPGFALLAAHERASVFGPDLAGLDHQFREQAQGGNRLKELNAVLPELEKRLEASVQAHEQASEALAKADARQEDSRKLWEEVSELDKEVATAREVLTQAIQHRLQADQQAAAADHEKRAASKELEGLEAKRKMDSLWFGDHSSDSEISPKLPEIQSGYVSWVHAEESKAAEGKALEKAQQEFALLSDSVTQSQRKLAPLEAALKGKDDAVEAIRIGLAKLRGEAALSEIECARDAAQQRRIQLEKLSEQGGKLRQLTVALEQNQKRLELLVGTLAQSNYLFLALQQTRERAAKLVEARQAALSFAERLQSLEAHRAALKESEPCPLCGSTEHPFAGPEAILPMEVAGARRELKEANQELEQAQEKLAQEDAKRSAIVAEQKQLTDEVGRITTERQGLNGVWNEGIRGLQLDCEFRDADTLALVLAEAVQAEESLKGRVAQVRQAEHQLQGAQREAQEARTVLDQQRADHSTKNALAQQAEHALPGLKAAASRAGELAKQEKAVFTEQITPFAPVPTEVSSAGTVLQQLKVRAEIFAKRQAELARLDAQIGNKQTKVETLVQQVEQRSKAAGAARSCEESASKRLAERQAVRLDRFGERSVAEAREQAASELKRLRAAVDAAREGREQQRASFDQAVKEKANVEHTMALRGQELIKLQSELVPRAQSSGFADLDSLRAALLPTPEALRLGAQRKELEERRVAAESRAKILAAERAKIPDSAEADAQNLPGIQEQKTAMEARQGELNRAVGAIIESLKKDDELRARQQGIAAQIEATRREFTRWDRLRALIGSADGSAFARFAQGLTLERLVMLANRHLLHLNPRYSLRRATGQSVEDLDLEIVDHYQADASRPMRSLSGGESFLASLSLALGLSELASGSTSIESIFIDEGFGSLDADTLETAMAALENLQARGKTVGVISHVPAMQERISSQIRVQKESAGCSRIELVS